MGNLFLPGESTRYLCVIEKFQFTHMVHFFLFCFACTVSQSCWTCQPWYHLVFGSSCSSRVEQTSSVLQDWSLDMGVLGSVILAVDISMMMIKECTIQIFLSSWNNGVYVVFICVDDDWMFVYCLFLSDIGHNVVFLLPQIVSWSISKSLLNFT
jgi:hypothetical protein